MYPAINPEVKCAFRWYKDQRRVARFSPGCMKDGKPEECLDYALWAPNNALLPFQLRVDSGQSEVTSWRIYDLDGVEVANLSADIPLIQVNLFVGRDYLTYKGDVLSAVLGPGKYEARLVVSGVTYYSETFQTFCGSYDDTNILPNGDFTDGHAHFSVDTDWEGYALARFNTLPIIFPSNPDVGDKVISRGDSMLYTWDGSSWVGSTPAEGASFIVGTNIDTIEWWRFLSGTWVAGSAFVTFFEGSGACWTGNGGVPLIYTPGLSETTVVRLSMRAFYGLGIVGSLVVAVDGDTVATLNNAVNGQTVEVSVTLNPGSTITFTPTANFKGCLSFLHGFAFSADASCFHRLSWSNCGVVGTQFYDDGFENVIYIPQEHIIHSPSPEINIDDEEDQEGAKQETFQRKEVNYTLSFGLIPWYQLDALTEIPLHSEVSFKAAGNSDEDALVKVTVDHTWTDGDSCLADCSMTFQVDEATVVSSCCESFDPPCVVPCVAAVGFSDDPDPQLGDIYLMVGSARYATYEGFENGPVDINGFGAKTLCTSRLAVIGDDYYVFTNGAWELLVQFTFVQNNQDGTYFIAANIQGGYSAQLQYAGSEAGPFTPFDPDITYSGDQWETGVEVPVPHAGLFFKLMAVGVNCEIGASAIYPCLEPDQMPNGVLDSLTGWYFNSTTYWTTVPTTDDLDEIVDPGTGDKAFVTGNGTFYQWNGSSWVAMASNTWPIQITENGACFSSLGGTGDGYMEFQFPNMTAPFVNTEIYQVLMQMDITSGSFCIYLASPICVTADSLDDMGYVEIYLNGPIGISALNARFSNNFAGCLKSITVRKRCD